MNKVLELIEDYKEKYNLEDEFNQLRKNAGLSPFSYEIDCLAYLLTNNYISYNEYKNLELEYTNDNKYLSLYDLAPRTFGETWGEQHILKLFPEFSKETVENNPEFDGEYDLIYNDIRVEVKACRANNSNGGGSLSSRAYSHEQAKEKGFKYHFQQLKPSCCDVFIWIGVCRDSLIYWVLTSQELKETGKLGSQHRNENTGLDVEVYEGQVFMTEDDLLPFLVEEKDVLNMVEKKGKKVE